MSSLVLVHGLLIFCSVQPSGRMGGLCLHVVKMVYVRETLKRTKGVPVTGAWPNGQPFCRRQCLKFLGNVFGGNTVQPCRRAVWEGSIWGRLFRFQFKWSHPGAYRGHLTFKHLLYGVCRNSCTALTISCPSSLTYPPYPQSPNPRHPDDQV